MRKNLITLSILILSFNCYSQITFEKGFYINNDGQKTICLIKNIDWVNNPTEFQIKLNENNEVKTITIDNVKEVTIYNISKHIRANVKIDKSFDNLQKLSHDKNPIFSDELLFLKVLVEGKASLYYYENENLKRYFYKNNNDKIDQLVYKSYLISDNSAKKDNNKFRQQLWTDLKCENISINDIEKINYKKSDLVNLFIKYNKCHNSEIINFENKKQKDLFNLNIRPRLNYSSLSRQGPLYTYSFEGNELGIGFGLEAEFIFPFNKNKWAILVEATYQSFKSEKTTNISNVSGGKLITEVDYSSIKAPVGLRHYFFLNKDSKIFTDISLIIDINSNSSIKYKRADNTTLDREGRIGTKPNWGFGMGYKMYDKYSLEMRYETKNTDFRTISMIFGYSIF